MPFLDFMRLRNVQHSDGLVECRVPRDWVEEVEDDGTRVLWKPDGISGTLRITLLTAKREIDVDGNPAMYLLGDAGDKAPAYELPNGNGFRRYRKVSSEEEEELAIHWFEIANYAPPIYYRLVMFSFTVLLKEEATPAIQRQLEVLERELPKCNFLSEVQPWER